MMKSIFEKLEGLRQEPVEKRRRILFATLTVSMAIVIVIWVGTLKYQNSGENAQSSRGPSPWQVVRNMFKTSGEELKKIAPGEVYLRE